MDSFFKSLWDRTPHSFKWLIEVVAGEFWEDRDTSAMVADMLASFVPGVIIVTSARDLLAVIYHMGRDPKRREEVTQWMLLIACIIPLILPLLGAAAGFAAAGVGSIVGAIGGSEVGALLRAVCLALIERSGAVLSKVVEFLRTFIHGDLIAVLKEVKFAQYGAKIGEAVEKIIAQFLVILKRIRGQLALLRYIDPYGKVEAALARLQELEEGFYSVQLVAAHKIPLALAELDNRLAKLLTEDMAALEHAVHPGFPAPKPKPILHEPARVPTMSDNPLGRPNGTTRPEHLPPATAEKPNLHPQKAEVDLAEMEEKRLPCFKGNKLPAGMAGEMDRQLAGQERGLNNMTVQEYLDGRSAYQANGRGDPSVARDARIKYQQELTADYTDNYIETGETPARAAELARSDASSTMSTLAALHNPDQVAAGANVIGDFGDKTVNSTIGGQWASNVPSVGQTRVEILDAAAKKVPSATRSATRMNVKLEQCK